MIFETLLYYRCSTVNFIVLLEFLIYKIHYLIGTFQVSKYLQLILGLQFNDTPYFSQIRFISSSISHYYVPNIKLNDKKEGWFLLSSEYCQFARRDEREGKDSLLCAGPEEIRLDVFPDSKKTTTVQFLCYRPVIVGLCSPSSKG